MARKRLRLSGRASLVAISNVPYLTPDDVPEERDCRALLIPASSDWLAIFSGALTELSKEWNWEQQGITVDEALAVVAEVINGYYAGCETSGCTLPGGYPPFRLDENGNIQELVNGEWVTPEGIYTLPPTPARTEPTEQERRCLAAANAAAVFAQLYEELSDGFQEGMTFQQWTEFLTATLIGLLGAVFGLVTAPLIAIGILIVGVIYEVIEFITADVWTTEFTEMFQCLLYECASDDADVIHFNFPCVLEKLSRVTDIFDPTFAQIRLFGQIAYIMQFLGAQSLDAMGATTAVETADCDACAPSLWCRISDWLAEEDGYVSGYPGLCPPYCSDWVLGQGWVPTGSPAEFNGFQRTFDPITVTAFHLNWTGSGGAATAQISIELYLSGTQVGVWASNESGDDGEIIVNDIATLADQIVIGGNNLVGAGTFAFTSIEVVYSAVEPVLGDDNCP